MHIEISICIGRVPYAMSKRYLQRLHVYRNATGISICKGKVPYAKERFICKGIRIYVLHGQPYNSVRSFDEIAVVQLEDPDREVDYGIDISFVKG
jgi:hypothetical protein